MAVANHTRVKPDPRNPPNPERVHGLAMTVAAGRERLSQVSSDANPAA